MSSLYRFVRGTLYVWITCIIALSYMVEYYIKLPFLTPPLNMLSAWGALMVSFMTLVAFLTLFRIHIRRIITKPPRWQLSIWMMIVMIVTIVVGNSSSLRTSHPAYTWLYFIVIMTLFLAAMSMTHYVKLSAMFRGFRVKNLESAILLIVCIICILGVMPMLSTTFLYPLQAWIVGHPSLAGNRAGVIIAGVGAIGISLRIWFGKEKGLRAG